MLTNVFTPPVSHRLTPAPTAHFTDRETKVWRLGTVRRGERSQIRGLRWLVLSDWTRIGTDPLTW